MLIVCPSCAARYEIDAAKLGPAGRKVRCARCRTPWQVEPAAQADAPEEPAETPAEPMLPPIPSAAETTSLLEDELLRAAAGEAGEDEPAPAIAPAATSEAEPESRPRPPARRRRPTRKEAGRAAAAAAASARALRLPLALGCAGLLLLGALAWQREATVRAAPQLAGLFAAIGLPVNVLGLRLSAVESTLSEAGESRFLIVEGDVTNIARDGRPVPPIEVAVHDEAGQPLYTWTTDPPRSRLEPSELVRFRARLATPPPTGRSVSVRFAADSR